MKISLIIILFLTLLYLLNFSLDFDNKKKINNLTIKLNLLIDKFKIKYPTHNGLTNLNKKIIIKELPSYKNKIGYVYNKNVIYICIDKSQNELFFVLLHELSHIITKTEGHDNNYWNNFKLLLNLSIDLKLYKYKNYKDNPVKYCNKLINDTPL